MLISRPDHPRTVLISVRFVSPRIWSEMRKCTYRSSAASRYVAGGAPAKLPLELNVEPVCGFVWVADEPRVEILKLIR